MVFPGRFGLARFLDQGREHGGREGRATIIETCASGLGVEAFENEKVVAGFAGEIFLDLGGDGELRVGAGDDFAAAASVSRGGTTATSEILSKHIILAAAASLTAPC